MLNSQLADQGRRTRTHRNPRKRTVRAAAIDLVSGDGLAHGVGDMGDMAPHVVLRDRSSGAVIDTRRPLQDGPVALWFEVAVRCPDCNFEPGACQHTPRGIRRLDSTPVAVKPELQDRTSAAATSHRLDFPAEHAKP